MEKRFLEEQQIIEDAFRLGVQIFESGFRPSFIVGLWRGGSSVGIYVQECLQTLGVNTDHIALRTSYPGLPEYHNMVETPDKIRVHGTQYLIEKLNADDGLLIVDDVFSSGHNINAVINRLQSKLKRNMPQQVRIATLYQRKDYNRTALTPDFCLHQTTDWLVFPYELKGLSKEEIALHKPYAAPFIRDL
ncbi:phosphoribosyltransferase [Alteromonas lipolytica]|uniref:Hypoxanthine phosphoribosyltransferase n=1 Tax=Alteromonas lipolytica TaxID=1856405 RepID=A0A1E8FHG8_9ALTE|nr:phosphoribosyltransferase family protein [Alteromonas lipolytica]OFI35186.1 hypoxanthine phosphoribosyltransferase [Alteromonas lipolytica]GGF57451.1 hypoxanthine phosphoribosyltransferase [Alteromonas lipolytica]